MSPMSIRTRSCNGSSGTTRRPRPVASSRMRSCCPRSIPRAGLASRYLLARGVDERGFSFFTNYESAKSAELTAEPRAAMLFTWLQLHRQVRVVGVVERLPEAESDEYYGSRPRASQIGAWSSPQSQVLPDRASLQERVARFEETFATVEDVPAPGVLGWVAASSRCRTSSGRVVPAGCTTACATAAVRARRGSSSGWRRSPERGGVDETVDQGGHGRDHRCVVPVGPDRARAADARR